MNYVLFKSSNLDLQLFQIYVKISAIIPVIIISHQPAFFSEVAYNKIVLDSHCLPGMKRAINKTCFANCINLTIQF